MEYPSSTTSADTFESAANGQGSNLDHTSSEDGEGEEEEGLERQFRKSEAPESGKRRRTKEERVQSDKETGIIKVTVGNHFSVAEKATHPEITENPTVFESCQTQHVERRVSDDGCEENDNSIITSSLAKSRSRLATKTDRPETQIATKIPRLLSPRKQTNSGSGQDSVTDFERARISTKIPRLSTPRKSLQSTDSASSATTSDGVVSKTRVQL
jgi:hypothetical protein